MTGEDTPFLVRSIRASRSEEDRVLKPGEFEAMGRRDPNATRFYDAIASIIDPSNIEVGETKGAQILIMMESLSQHRDLNDIQRLVYAEVIAARIKKERDNG